MTDIEYAEQIITRLVKSRSKYLELHLEFLKAYPNWVVNMDARSNLIAKPINLLLVPIVSLKSFQDTTAHINYWSSRISNEFHSPEATVPTIKEIDIFNRYALFQFLLSNFEHGFRAIHANILIQESVYSQKPFKKIYEELFDKVFDENEAASQKNVFNFFRLLRNTIHNNGCFYPIDKKDVMCNISGKIYELKVGTSIEYFGWEHLLEYVELLRDTLTKFVNSSVVQSIPFIPDIAIMKE